MLVLSRKQREKIQIGDNITLTVLRVKGNSVRIGIEAPRDVKVVRGELEPISASEPPSTADSADSSDDVRIGNLSVFVSDPVENQVIEIHTDKNGPLRLNATQTEQDAPAKPDWDGTKSANQELSEQGDTNRLRRIVESVRSQEC